ncbi:MAG: sugar ABC transporter ATP-binding protein [Propionibacteriaceae bacterium]|nr:sugar ABC transporter ATP-binding protein [Propionibacteriaceae bacterium]
MSGEAILELKGVSKRFGSVVALRDAELTLYPGSIHAVIGENGAGKSTLVKIIAGLYQRDTGTFLMNGSQVHFPTTAASKAAGIAVIYQEPTLFPDLSVTENIFMGRQPLKSMRRIDRAAMRAEVLSLMERLGVRIDPDRPAARLSIADQQIIEIAKAISLDATVLIMDEPTAALSGVEVERLFAVARSLRDEGRALMFISHRFDEVFSLCDTVTVMRDGSYVATQAIADTDVNSLVRQMVGRDVNELFPKTEAFIGDPVLQVEGLTSLGTFSDISFTVRSGEIVALAGLVGAGRSESVRAVFGVDDYDSGTVTVDGQPLRKHNPREAMKAGIALVPEDRRRQGLIINAPVSTNITDAIRSTLSKHGFITKKAEAPAAQTWAGALEVKCAALDSIAGNLSGGNQQKAVLAKWLAVDPKVLIIDEPTRGIDVGTKSEVHRRMSDLAGKGMAILMISSELPEVLGMADRILVMHEGRITAEIPRAQASAESVMYAATHTREELGE